MFAIEVVVLWLCDRQSLIWFREKLLLKTQFGLNIMLLLHHLLKTYPFRNVIIGFIIIISLINIILVLLWILFCDCKTCNNWFVFMIRYHIRCNCLYTHWRELIHLIKDFVLEFEVIFLVSFQWNIWIKNYFFRRS